METETIADSRRLFFSFLFALQPQKRVVNLAPNIAQQETEERRDQLKGILSNSLTW